MTNETTDDPYRPIDCALHDRLEAAATVGRPADLAWADAAGRELSSRETIVDVFARRGEEFLTTASGLELRLDRILALDGVAFGAAARAPRVVLETERLVLRELGLDDAEFVLRLTNEPSFLEFIGDKGVRTLDDARNYIVTGPLDSYRRHGHGLLLVRLKEGGEPIGTCGILRKDWLDAPDIGYAFLPSCWGRGYAQEAAAAVLEHGRRACSLGRIVAVVTPHNTASIRLLEKLGMRLESTVVDPRSGEPLALFA
jgi:RimJ/RimL family protein N-acetyltransferase/transcriptional antiterminator Rof (Rho-off)